MPTKFLGRLAFGLLIVVSASSAFAQNAGSLRGVISDTSGAVVPGATLTLTDEGTKFTRTAVSDAKGSYFFATVAPGHYGLKVEISGFKPRQFTHMRISPNDTRGFDVALEVGGQAEELTVTAERELVDRKSVV